MLSIGKPILSDWLQLADTLSEHTFVDVGASTFLASSSEEQGDIDVHRLNADGTLSLVGSFEAFATSLDASANLDIRALDPFAVDGTPSLLVADANGRMKLFQLGSDGLPDPTKPVVTSSYPDLSLPVVVPVNVPASNLVVVTSPGSDTFRVIEATSDGALTNVVATIADGDVPALQMSDIQDLHIASVGTKSFAYVSSGDEHSVNIFEIAADGSASFVAAQVFGSADGDLGDIRVLSTGSAELLLVEDLATDRLLIHSLAADGTLQSFGSVARDTPGFGSLAELQVIHAGGQFLLAGYDDANGKIEVYAIEADGTARSVHSFNVSGNIGMADSVQVHAAHGKIFVLVETDPTSGQQATDLRVYEIGAGDDLIRGTLSADLMLGFDGNDELRGRQGADRLEGGAGNDNLKGGAGADTLIGGLGADILDGGGGRDLVDYSASHLGVSVDMIKGVAAGGTATGDRLIAVEELRATSFNDSVWGSHGNNAIEGGEGDDRLTGRGGADNLQGNAGDDLLVGNKGNDWLRGGKGNDTLRGGADNDTLSGSLGGDLLAGGAGDDHLDGGYGNDSLRGGIGNDMLVGGAGNDTFIFSDKYGEDTVADFAVGQDIVDLRGVKAVEIYAEIETALVEIAGDTILTFGTDSLTLKGVSITELTQDSFLFG
ncbi:MAG: hypothetical protein GJ676_03715 [Rhodobacteraceae bacterium]|nr:hypothetical protein [Paracoccaceae bacterium]